MITQRECPNCHISKNIITGFKPEANGVLANCCRTCQGSQKKKKGGYVPKGAYCDLKETAGKLYKGDLTGVPEFLHEIWENDQREIMQELRR